MRVFFHEGETARKCISQTRAGRNHLQIHVTELFLAPQMVVESLDAACIPFMELRRPAGL